MNVGDKENLGISACQIILLYCSKYYNNISIILLVMCYLELNAHAKLLDSMLN